jgi:murein DD-endopeptidase MepM/ murein hydrolase activator NlpD
MVPVAGVRVDQLSDTFNAARGEGRSHDAIDIMAPGGTPVVAAAGGVIARFFDSIPGGTTIYQFTTDRKYMLYYAHLQKRADGLKAGDQVAQGQVIGYVGDTGNAGKGNFHLHFSIAVVRDPARYWEGDYLNPFPLLRRSAP